MKRRGKHRYSRVSRRIWRDARFRRLSAPKPNGRDLFIWLLTCAEQSVVPGLIAIGEAGMAEELEWPVEGLRKAFGEVLREGLAKADFEARLVWIPKRIEHDPPASPNVISSWADDWDELPECDLKEEAYRTLHAYTKAKGKPWLEAFDKACPKPSGNQDQDQDQDQDQEEVVARAPTRPRVAPSVPPPPPPPPPVPSVDPRHSAMARELERHTKTLPSTITGDAMHAAEQLMGVVPMPRGTAEEQAGWLVANIRKCVAELPPGVTDAEARRKLRRFVERTDRDPQLRVAGGAVANESPAVPRYPVFPRDDSKPDIAAARAGAEAALAALTQSLAPPDPPKGKALGRAT